MSKQEWAKLLWIALWQDGDLQGIFLGWAMAVAIVLISHWCGVLWVGR